MYMDYLVEGEEDQWQESPRNEIASCLVPRDINKLGAV